MLVTGKRFRNATIQLDGNSFQKCTFTSCRLVFSGYMLVQIDHCEFDDDVAWSFAGPASTTIEFMKALYAGGAKQVIENTFQAIRGEKPPVGGPTLH